MSNNELQRSIGNLYSKEHFTPIAWTDAGNHSFINNHLIERSIAYLAPALQGELLDVGCGEQPYNPYFSHLKKTNCDFDAKRGTVDFACPADNIPVADGSFDAILCTEVLEHVPEPLKVWREFHRVLRPGGKVLLSTPMYWPAHELPYDFYRYPEHGLRYLAETNGFKVIEVMPRGGIYAFLGQAIVMGIPQYFPFNKMRQLWNKLFLFFDRSRLNPRMTLGWTILAEKVG